MPPYPREVDAALAHADWWAGKGGNQDASKTTDAMRILSAEVRRLREKVATLEGERQAK